MIKVGIDKKTPYPPPPPPPPPPTNSLIKIICAKLIFQEWTNFGSIFWLYKTEDLFILAYIEGLAECEYWYSAVGNQTTNLQIDPLEVKYVVHSK